MRGTLSKFDRDVVPLHDDGIFEGDQYRSVLRTLHSQAVVPNRVLGTRLLRLNYHHSNATFLDPSAPLLLSYVQGHCRLLNFYKTRITAGVTDVRPDHTPLNICSSVLPA